MMPDALPRALPTHSAGAMRTGMPNAMHVRTYGLTKKILILRNQSSGPYRARAYVDPIDPFVFASLDEELNPA